MTSADRTPILHVHPRARILLPVFLVLLIGFSLNRFVCREPQAPPYVQLHGQTMGTTWSATVVTPENEPAMKPGMAIQRAVNRVDSLLSTYKPDSELMRFNRNSSVEAVPVSREFAEVVSVAQTVSRLSGGALDITVWPLVEAWGFGAGDAPSEPPRPQELDALRIRIGYQRLQANVQANTLIKTRGDVFCDVSAVAKGYGVDAACEALLGAGYQAFLVEVGGELRARGRHPHGRPWTIAVEKPDPTRREPTIRIPLNNQAAATSGSYRNFVEQGGKRRSHILDPRTLAPVDHDLVSVTVLHPRAAEADAWATALMVLGSEEGLRLAQGQNLAAYFIVDRGNGEFAAEWTASWPEFDASEGW